MKQIARCLSAIVLVAAVFVSTSPAAAPPENSIPIIVIKSNDYESPPAGGIDIDFLCSLVWRYIDGIEYAGWPSAVEAAVGYCDSTGMLFLFAPGHIGEFKLGGSPTVAPTWWARVEALTSGNAFKQADYLGDSWVETMTAATMDSFIDARMNALQTETADFPDVIWFFNVWDEANTNQRGHMTSTSHPYDDYFPNVYTQDTTMTRVDSCSVFSWIKYIEENDHGGIPVTINFGMHHTISSNDYPGFTGSNPPPSGGTFEVQANAVRAFCNMRYQPRGAGIVQDNYPEFICFDYYPFRQVLKDSSLGGDPNATMCDSSWLYLINHFEEGLDSTVLAAAESDVPVFYYAQAFGCGGGPRILHWNDSLEVYDSVEYPSYSAYRPPAPQEFLLDCNLALLHQCKGIFPYSVRSYWEAWSSSTEIPSNFLSCSMLDVDLVPFDTPYENYVYRKRITGNYDQDYVSPDSLPPFDGYDPLYSLPSFPDTSGAKGKEHYYEWLFEPYGNLWDSLRETFASIAWIAPEMYDLWWYDGYEDVADIACIDTVTYQSIYYTGPEIKVFGDSNACYLFYVNRYCRVNGVPFRIYIDENSLPSGVVTHYLLSHSERCIMPVDSVSGAGVHFFSDTLDAGEARLVQFVGSSVAADARLTRPDIYAACGAQFSIRDMEFTAGDDIDVNAIVYNMGTSQQASVRVRLWDDTEDIKVDSALFTLPALSTSSQACACDTVTLDWNTDSTDIGVHLMRVEVVSWYGEPDTDDNSATLPFLIRPRDYATEVRENAWDMTEAVSSPPAWKTNDISDESGWTSFSDSISGMFEGVIDEDSLTTNRLYLDLDGTTDIDGDLYNQVSLACISPDAACDVIIGWEDTSHGSGTETIYEDLPAGEWIEIGPYDLSGDWSHRTIETLWLRFSFAVKADYPVRIGWVRLEEEGN